MPLARRQFLQLTAGGFATSLVGVSASARAAASPSIKAVAFDAFTTFDPQPVFALAERLFPNRGIALSNAWRTRQFEYTWLRTLSRRYVDFWQVTQEALVFAAKSLKLELNAEKRQAFQSLQTARLFFVNLPVAMPGSFFIVPGFGHGFNQGGVRR